MRHMMLEVMNVWFIVKQTMIAIGSHMTLMDGFV